MTAPAYRLNETQLELRFNITSYLTLCTFKEPLTPSEAARRLGIPANIAHYRAKRLLNAGLLTLTEAGKRRGCYNSVACQFLVPDELLHVLGESSLQMIDGMLGKLHRAMMTRSEQRFRELGSTTQPLTFDLSGNLDLSREDRRYPGGCYISSVNLSPAQYRKVLGAMETLLEGITEDEGGKTCTLAFIAFVAPLPH